MGRKILLLGHPPNSRAIVIPNPSAGQPDYRNASEYQLLCRELRQRMGDQ
jgi:hypothetical protein